jgi:DTW domain-containing protein YfiP
MVVSSHITGSRTKGISLSDAHDTPDHVSQPDGFCPTCGKPDLLCVCADVEPVENRIAVLVLQHPQEQDKTLGSARLLTHILQRADFRIGLSWPSLAKALGRPADPKRWAVLHLGSIQTKDFPGDADIALFDAKGVALPDQSNALKGLEGVILFDGTWSQAKTLWWRNAWVLKARRIALRPMQPSLYGALRKEPRREGLSTIEAAGMVLARLEDNPEIESELRGAFSIMLARYRAACKAGKVGKPSDA